MTSDLDEVRRRGWAIVSGDRQRRLGGAHHLPPRQRPAARPRGAARRSSTPANSATAAPSATCPAARASSPRSRGPAEGTLVVDGSIAGVGLLETPISLTVRGGHLTDATGAEGAALMELLSRARRGRHQRRRARDRHQRRGDPDRQHPRGREDPRHRPRRLRRLGGDRRHRPGPGPPRLRGARTDRRNRRRDDRQRRRAAALRVGDAGPARRPQRLGGARRRSGWRGSQTAFGRGVRLLDLHTDADHDRTVFTLAGEPGALTEALVAGAEEALETIDMAYYRGAHPAIGALDVCPLVWLDPADREAARTEAVAVAAQIGGLGVPVFLYGELARDPAAPSAPTSATAAWPSSGCGWRRGELRPDFGPALPHPQRRRHPGHRPPAARRLQRRARQRRPRGRPRRRRRPARVGRRAAGRAGDRAAAVAAAAPRSRPTSTTRWRCRWARWSSGCASWRRRSAPARWRRSWSASSRPPPSPTTRRTCRSAASTPPGT